jgi:cell division protease FtsH
MASHVTYSEETAAIIDEEVKGIISDALAKARKLLGENKKLLDNMAMLLFERETIFTEEVDMLMDGKSVEEIVAFMDENERKLQENPFGRKSARGAEKEETIAKEPVAEPESNEEQEKNQPENKDENQEK